MAFRDSCDSWFQMFAKNLVVFRFFAMLFALGILSCYSFIIALTVIYHHWLETLQGARQLDIIGKSLWINQAMVFLSIAALWQVGAKFKGFGTELEVGSRENKE